MFFKSEISNSVVLADSTQFFFFRFPFTLSRSQATVVDACPSYRKLPDWLDWASQQFLNERLSWNCSFSSFLPSLPLSPLSSSFYSCAYGSLEWVFLKIKKRRGWTSDLTLPSPSPTACPNLCSNSSTLPTSESSKWAGMMVNPNQSQSQNLSQNQPLLQAWVKLLPLAQAAWLTLFLLSRRSTLLLLPPLRVNLVPVPQLPLPRLAHHPAAARPPPAQALQAAVAAPQVHPAALQLPLQTLPTTWMDWTRSSMDCLLWLLVERTIMADL